MANASEKTNKSIAIVVMGDLDRSPRMANHALSAIRSNLFSKVDLIGYRGSGLNQQLVQHEGKGVFRAVYVGTLLVDLLKKLPRFLYLLYALLRIVIQTLQLTYRLLLRPGRRYDYILIQNPPCVPLLLVCFVIVRPLTCFRTKIIIDWHNYGFSIMRVNGVNPRIVWMARQYEMELGKFADFHLTVSKAMKTDLLRQMPTIREQKIQVLYDKATDKFKEVSLQDQYDLYERIGLNNQLTCHGVPTYDEDRPVLCLSSTSYTPDEDFNMLVEALDICDKNPKVPAIEMLVTGKGPQKAFYQQVFNARNSKWKKTKIRQAWLQIDDYPKVVSCADLGVCLHASSSGLDLPMKVVDMFSAKLPCLALGGFSSISELVKPEFGMTFLNKEELAQQMEEVLINFDFETTTEKLRTFRSNLASFVAPENSWEAQWTRVLANKVFSEETSAQKVKVN